MAASELVQLRQRHTVSGLRYTIFLFVPYSLMVVLNCSFHCFYYYYYFFFNFLLITLGALDSLACIHYLAFVLVALYSRKRMETEFTWFKTIEEYLGRSLLFYLSSLVIHYLSKSLVIHSLFLCLLDPLLNMCKTRFMKR
jgi:hypothetical protein